MAHDVDTGARHRVTSKHAIIWQLLTAIFFHDNLLVKKVVSRWLALLFASTLSLDHILRLAWNYSTRYVVVP